MMQAPKWRSQHSDNTIDSTRSYSKPSGLGTWDKDSFYLDYTEDDYQHLTEIPYTVWRESFRQGTQTTGKPDHFIITPAGNIYLEPIPDGAYALTADYWKAPTRMTTNTSTSAIPGRFERIIIAQAKIYYAEHEEFPSVLELATNEYNDLLRRLESAELNGFEPIRRSQAVDINMVERII
jgi:hypothetical protein